MNEFSVYGCSAGWAAGPGRGQPQLGCTGLQAYSGHSSASLPCVLEYARHHLSQTNIHSDTQTHRHIDTQTIVQHHRNINTKTQFYTHSDSNLSKHFPFNFNLSDFLVVMFDRFSLELSSLSLVPSVCHGVCCAQYLVICHTK
jgi:hypothetical protein